MKKKKCYFSNYVTHLRKSKVFGVEKSFLTTYFLWIIVNMIQNKWCIESLNMIQNNTYNIITLGFW